VKVCHCLDISFTVFVGQDIISLSNDGNFFVDVQGRHTRLVRSSHFSLMMGAVLTALV
jgi:hypothetical protein